MLLFIIDETLDQLLTPRKLARPESVAVRSTLGAIHSGYGVWRATYDVKKLRGKSW